MLRSPWRDDRVERDAQILRLNKRSHGILFITDAGARGLDLKLVGAVHIVEPADNLQEERQIINRAVRYKAHRTRNACVFVYRYILRFPETHLVEAPWKRVVYESGLFEKSELPGLTAPLQESLRRIIQDEEEGQTLDERILVQRAERDAQVQAALTTLLD